MNKYKLKIVEMSKRIYNNPSVLINYTYFE